MTTLSWIFVGSAWVISLASILVNAWTFRQIKKHRAAYPLKEPTDDG